LVLVLFLLAGNVFSVIEGSIDHGGGPKQERNNRMVPDFKPFHHPSDKILSSGFLGPSGPISSVHWLELVPVFGALYAAPDPRSKSSNLLYVLGFGAGSFCLAGYFFKKNSSQNEKDIKIKKEENQRREIRRDRGEERDRAKQEEEKLIGDMEQQKIEEEDRIRQQQKRETKRRQLQNREEEHQRLQQQKREEEDRKIQQQQGEEEHQRLHQQKGEEEDRKIQQQKGEEEDRNKLQAVGVVKQEEPVKPKESKKRKVSYAMEEESGTQKFENKVKIFKMTKVPKTHNCSSSDHGVLTEVLTIEEVFELEKTEKLNTVVQTSLADIIIEGANISRLRITDVVEKSEEKYVSKTMTIKEYMMSMANSKIEEAVKMVKADCSLQNIKNLADTIKKYRPESNQEKSNGI